MWLTISLYVDYLTPCGLVTPHGDIDHGHQLFRWLFVAWRHQVINWTNIDLAHWGRVTHICVDNLTSIGSDNGLSPGRRQAIIRTNAGIWFIGPSGTNFSGILIGIHTFSFKKIHLKISSAKWRPVFLGLNVLTSLRSRENHLM